MEEKILRCIRVGCNDFSDSEVAFVAAVIKAYDKEMSSRGKRRSMETRFIAVGEDVMVSGHRMRCVERFGIYVPRDVCKGCSISKLYLGCSDLQCSSFTRRDKKNVWFIEDWEKRSDEQ